MDSYLTNKFVKSSKDAKGHVLSVGALECWQLKEDKENGGFKYTKVWATAFKSQAICLHWCPEKSYLMVGCDNGEIIPIEVDIDDIEEWTELKKYKIHKARVMDMWLDADKNHLYSVSEDKYLHCFDFKTKEIITSKKFF